MILYPATLPLDDVKLLIKDLRAGSVGTDRVAVAKALWELTGYALKSTLDEPAGAPRALSVSPTANILSILETLLLEGVANIPWKTVAQWGLTELLTHLGVPAAV